MGTSGWGLPSELCLPLHQSISDWHSKKTKSQGNKMLEGVEMAPFRSIDEFLTSESKFEMPELSNIEKMSGKVVSNLLYYQTNYFVTFAIIFLLVFFFVPWKMIYIVILLALVFGAQYYMSLHHVHVKTLVVKGPFWKKKKEIELEPNEFYQITSVSEVAGVSRETPMAKLLHEWGIPAEFKCIS